MRLRIVLACVLSAAMSFAAAAQDQYADLKALETSYKSGSASREDQLRLARMYIDAGRFYEASKVVNTLTAANAGDAEAAALREEATRGLRVANERRVGEAETAARAAGATDADRLALADAYFDAGNYTAASAAYAKLPASVMTPEVQTRHARALAWSGQFDDAEAAYGRVLATASTPELELEYARLLSWMGATGAANERLLRLHQQQRNEQTALALANSLAWSGDRDAALRVLSDYVATDANAVEARTAMTNFRTSPAVRVERLDKLIALDPHNLALRVERARMLLDTQR